MKPGDLEMIWKAALHETFPDALHRGWTKRDYGAVKHWQDNFCGGTFADFLDWSVRNWTGVVRTQFKSLKKTAPAAPSMTFFSQPWVREAFANAYTERAKRKWLSGPERTALERLIGEGLSEEHAMLRIAEDRAKDAMREEVDKKRNAARQALASAEHRLGIAKAVERANELAGKIPMSPRSKRAQELGGPKSRLQPGAKSGEVRDEIGDRPLNLVSMPKIAEFEPR